MVLLEDDRMIDKSYQIPMKAHLTNIYIYMYLSNKTLKW